MKKRSSYSTFRQSLKRRHFQRSGMKPWTRGYAEFKAREIARVLADPNLFSDPLPTGFGFRLDERIVEYPWFFSRLPAAPGVLLDAGSTLNFDFVLEHSLLQNKKIHICTLAPEADCFWEKNVSYLFDDLRCLPYRNDWFDWVVSISTLEHVGMDNTIYTADSNSRETGRGDHLGAVAELRRVLKPGGTAYLTVPFGLARKHGWLQVFDQSGIDCMVQTFDSSQSKLEYFLYHSEGWRRSSAEGAAHATFYDIHRATGYDPDFAASARAVCCLELRKPL